MERKAKTRLLIGGLVAFSVITAAYTYVVVFADPETRVQDWQAFLLNVSTELIGALIVFFFFNLFFFLDDWDLSERVAQLLNRLDREHPRAEKFFQKMPDIGPMIQEADAIDLCGVSLTSTINRHFTLLRDSLAEGTPVRLLIIDPRTTAIEMANARSESQDIAYYKKRLDASLSDIGYLWEKCKGFSETENPGSLEVRLMPYAPSFGLLIFHKAKSKGQMNIEIYPHHGGFGSPPIFCLNELEDSSWYQYYKDQFKGMWEKSIVWNPTNEKDTLDLLQSSNRLSADDFLMREIPAYQNHIEQSQKVYLYGDTLQTTISRNFSALNNILKKGGSIKIILSSIEAGLWESGPMLRQESLRALSRLYASPQNTGSIEVREFNKPRFFSIHIFDPQSERGRLLIRLDSQTPAYKARPKFELLKNRDDYWFNYFLEQWEYIWSQSQPIDIVSGLDRPQFEEDKKD